MRLRHIGFLLAFGSVGLCVRAQTPAPKPAGNDTVPIYSVTVVQKALRAVNYQRSNGPTSVDMRGTILLPKADGTARVEVKNGYTEINAVFHHLTPPTQFGTEYLTYVLWAITPDGRAINLGELIPDGSNNGKMRVTCPNSTFGLLVTAEPYFSVLYPSDVVVMENSIRPDTAGRVEDIEAKYQLLPRGQYTLHIQPSALASAHMNNTPGVSIDQYNAILALYEARNAVQIARADGAGQAALSTLQKAQTLLTQAEAAYNQKGPNYGEVTALARQAVQAAADARAIAVHDKAPQASR